MATAFIILILLCFVFLVFICVMPFILLISSSVTEESHLIKEGYGFIPKAVSWDAYKYLLVDSQIKIFLTAHQLNVSLKWTENITENHNQSKCRVVESSPNGYIYNTTPTSKAQGSWWQWEEG